MNVDWDTTIIRALVFAFGASLLGVLYRVWSRAGHAIHGIPRWVEEHQVKGDVGEVHEAIISVLNSLKAKIEHSDPGSGKVSALLHSGTVKDLFGSGSMPSGERIQVVCAPAGEGWVVLSLESVSLPAMADADLYMKNVDSIIDALDKAGFTSAKGGRFLEAERQIKGLYGPKVNPSPENVAYMATHCRFCGDQAAADPQALRTVTAQTLVTRMATHKEYLVPVCMACYEKLLREGWGRDSYGRRWGLPRSYDWRGMSLGRGYAETRLYTAQPDALYQTTLSALNVVGAKIASTDPKTMIATAKIGVSLWSSAEYITVGVRVVDPKVAELAAVSKAAKIQMFHGKRNKRNVAKLFELVEEAGTTRTWK